VFGVQVNPEVRDRRRSLRHVLRIPVRLRILGLGGAEVWGYSINLSESGVLLETGLPLEVGTDVELGLTLLEETTHQPTTEWRCRGRVVHSLLQTSLGGASRFGVRFDSLDASRPGVSGWRQAQLP